MLKISTSSLIPSKADEEDNESLFQKRSWNRQAEIITLLYVNILCLFPGLKANLNSWLFLLGALFACLSSWFYLPGSLPIGESELKGLLAQEENLLNDLMIEVEKN